MLNQESFYEKVYKKLKEKGFTLTKKEVKEILKTNDEAIKEELLADGYKQGKLFKITPVDRKARVARNPQTNKEIKVPAKKGLKFKVMENFKSEVEKSGKKKSKKK